MIGIEVAAPEAPTAIEIEELCALALASADIEEGHVAVEFVDEERIREGGCEAYLSKPISVAKFLATVRAYLEPK